MSCKPSNHKEKMQAEAMFGGGCFWGIQALFDKVEGVLSTAVGYAGGTTVDPSYEQVCSGETGHAEVVHLRFDPQRVSYQKLLEIFFENHDPTTLNRQGPDVGTQYRSVIFVYDAKQKNAAQSMVETLNKSANHRRPVVTEILPAPPFYRAEQYHQNYLCQLKR
jgi:peptide-methionine (S)-S-oxide reductase